MNHAWRRVAVGSIVSLLGGCAGRSDATQSDTARDATVVVPRPALRTGDDGGDRQTGESGPGRKLGRPEIWPGDAQAVLAAARAEGRPALVVFYAAWSSPCVEQAKLFAEPEVAAALDRRFVAARVDMTDDASPAAESARTAFDVQGLPTLIVFDAKGKEVARRTEYLDVDRLLALLAAVP